MRKMNRVIYFVEGECEAKLINALKEAPAVIRPGKIKDHQCDPECAQFIPTCSDTGRNNRCPGV